MMENSDIQKSSTPSILSYIIIILTYGILFTLLFHPVPEPNKDLVNILSSSIISLCVGGIIGYWYSSSHAKKANEKNLSDNLNNNESINQSNGN